MVSSKPPNPPQSAFQRSQSFQVVPVKSATDLTKASSSDEDEEPIKYSPDNDNINSGDNHNNNSNDIKTPVEIDDHNRTMVLQVDRTDLRLISPDRKVILLHKHHKDVSNCLQVSFISLS